jgi:pyruvate dehydrogenase E1 component beta subunit|tara:strand:+ start:569 stop:1549 length:981 start_codon:yes stop_codon:yes gene_type:complete
MRTLSYSGAILEGFREKMESDEDVFILGQGVTNPWYVGDSMQDLDKIFGAERVIDPPVSEQGMNGVVVGAALAGMKPIVVHPRVDFLVMGIEQIINEAANWSYMFDGQISMPLTVRAIINRGGEQAAQHSQALQAIFMHIPGLKVVMPSSPYDAKGLLISSIEDPDPVIYIDDRWLYDLTEDVPEGLYRVPIGKGKIRIPGEDITIVAISSMVPEAEKASNVLLEDGIKAEVIDLRTLKPWDTELVLDSVRKTGNLIIADAAWRTAGSAAEISAHVVENLFSELKAPPVRVTLPDVPAPASRSLEEAYYIDSGDIINAVRKTLDTN